MKQFVLNFHLDIFEGPLDLLLFLIKKNEFNIFDIPISEITSQYLEYLNILEEIGIDTLSDYMAMAALLMEIKSRMLVPSEEKKVDSGESADPREELVELLLNYQMFQVAAERLASRPLLDVHEFTRPQDKKEVKNTRIEDISPFELARTYEEILSRSKALTVKLDVIDSIKISRELHDYLKKAGEFVFNDYIKGHTRLEKAVYFIALLDMVNNGIAGASQKALFDKIFVRMRRGNGE